MVGYDEGQVVSFEQDVVQAYRAAGRAPDLENVVWAARMVYDATAGGLGYPLSRAKHLAELVAALGTTPIPPPPGPIPPPPTREQILTGQTTQQGLLVQTDQFGAMPWWGACWAWLTPHSRAQAAQQLLAHGDTIALIAYPDGQPLYDEPGQFYSPDKFPALATTPESFADLIAETLGYGFQGCWVFWGGDDGDHGGFFESQAQTRLLSPVFATRIPGHNLNDYVVQIPGWDGVWHKPTALGTGYTPQQIQQFAADARAAGAKYVGIEGGTGYLLAGEGGGDYQPGGVMTGYDLILSEFFDGQFTTGDVWQILARYLGPAYVMPADQKAIIAAGPPTPNPPDSLYNQANDPHPPYVLAPGSPRGRYVHRVFEYYMYGFVRGATPAQVAASRAQFAAMGATHSC